MKNKVLFLIIILSIVLSACSPKDENPISHTYEIVIDGETLTLTSNQYGTCATHGVDYGKLRVMCQKDDVWVYEVMVDSFKVIE